MVKWNTTIQGQPQSSAPFQALTAGPPRDAVVAHAGG